MVFKNLNENLNANKAKTPTHPLGVSHRFGYFLAGLIDADGHIGKTGEVQITFHQRDKNVAKYIQTVVGSGGIYKVPKLRAYVYRCSQKVGVQKIADLIRHKLKLASKILQYNTRLVPKYAGRKTLCTPISAHTYWFAGFVMGDGCLQVSIRKPHKRSKKHQIEVVLGMELSNMDLVCRIKEVFGGHMGFRKSRHTYYYTTVNLKNASRLMTYFDAFPMFGSSQIAYLLWKRTLICVLNKDHLTVHGLETVRTLKQALTVLRL